MTEEQNDLPPSGEEDAETIWAELDAEEAASTPEKDPPSSQGDRDEFEDAGDADEDKGETGAQDGEKPAAATAPSPKAAPAAEPDPWANAPKELRETYERERRERQELEQKFNRERGRTSSLTKKLEQLAPPPAPPSPPTDDELKTVESEYPEVAKPLIKAIDALKGQVSSLTAAEQARHQQTSASEADAVRKVHPDYLKVIQDDPDGFDAWVRDERHPRWVLDAYEANGQQVVNAKDVIDIVTEWKIYKGLMQRPQSQQQSSGAQPKPQPSLADKRQRQLAGSVTPTTQRSTTPAGHSDVPEEGDSQQIWDAIEAKERRRARR
jgi:hypothetical protein